MCVWGFAIVGRLEESLSINSLGVTIKKGVSRILQATQLAIYLPTQHFHKFISVEAVLNEQINLPKSEYSRKPMQKQGRFLYKVSSILLLIIKIYLLFVLGHNLVCDLFHFSVFAKTNSSLFCNIFVCLLSQLTFSMHFKTYLL